MYIPILLAALLSSASAQTPPNFEFTSLVSTTKLTFGYPVYPDITPGQLLDLATVRAQPQPVVSFQGIAPDTTYTLLMIDPDARFPNGTSRIVLHWLQANISSSTPLSLPNATAISAYRAPGPPPEVPTRAHRYITLLFASALRLPAGYEASITARVGFDAVGFVKDAGLGQVVAANYYLTRNDSLVSNGTTSPTATPTGPTSAPTLGSPNAGAIVGASWGVLAIGAVVLFSGL